MLNSNFALSTFLLFSLLSCGEQENTHSTPESSSTAEAMEEVEEIVDTIDYEAQWMNERMEQIDLFAYAVLNDDIKTVSNYIRFPLIRDSPIPAIEDEEAFNAYYPTLFDSTLKEKIRAYLDNPDIIDLTGSNGTVGILNGLIWFNDPSTQIVSINYQSVVEKENQTTLQQTLKNSIHPILKDFDYNVFLGRTNEQLFRIDQTEKGLRYASWGGSQTISDEPDFILWNGVAEKQGTAGGWTTTFDNVDTKYILDEVYMCQDPADCGTFLVIEDEGEITSKLEVTEILNPFDALESSTYTEAETIEGS